MSMPLSMRGQQMPASQIRKLVPFAEQAKAKGIHVHHLNIGQPDIETDSSVLAALKTFDSKIVSYTHSRGDYGYIDSVLAYYKRMGVSLTREQVNITTGGSEAILFAFLLAMNPGDEVIIPEPFYSNYTGFACMAGIKIVPITTYGDNGFHLPNKSVFEELIGPRTKAILLCNPNNPTGTVYTRKEIDMIAELVIENRLWFFCDEVYREFVFDAKSDSYKSILQIPELNEQAVVLDSISKRYSMCGARLGCLVSRNTALMDGALRLAQARLSSPQIEQWMGIAAHQLSDTYFAAMIGEYRKRAEVVFQALRKMEGVKVVQPEGAFYLIPKLPIQDAEHFAQWLLTDFSLEGQTVMVSPAAGFYATKGLGEQEIRLAYVLQSEQLKQAMKVLQQALRVYPGRTR